MFHLAFLLIFYGLYHGRSPSNHHFGELFLHFSKHLTQIQVINFPLNHDYGRKAKPCVYCGLKRRIFCSTEPNLTCIDMRAVNIGGRTWRETNIGGTQFPSFSTSVIMGGMALFCETLLPMELEQKWLETLSSPIYELVNSRF